MISRRVCIIFLESVVYLPGVDEKTAFAETTNKQFRFETQARLEETLQQHYGQVRIYTCTRAGWKCRRKLIQSNFHVRLSHSTGYGGSAL